MIMNYDLTSFKKGLLELNIELSDKQFEMFVLYYEKLIEWNSFMNLTAITEWEDVVTKHFIDSLSIVKSSDFMTDASYTLLDVGTGAGFPGIPLKIAFPSLKVILLDSLNKRINFLNEVIDTLGLTGIECFHGRAEEYAHKKDFRQSFDYVVSRAVANMTVLSEFCVPFVKVNGCFISYKSDKAKSELDEASYALEVLGCEVSEVIEFLLPDSDLSRSVISVKKIKDTPSRYPRKAGLPSKEPLK